jgi:type II secretory pathway component PulF
MAKFKYKARDSFGTLIEETIEVYSKKDVENRLASLNYFPIEIKEIQEKTKFSSFFKQKVSMEDLSMFYRQFFTLVDAGLPIISSLNTVAKQSKNERFKSIIEHIVTLVEEGSTLHNAMENYPDVFTPLHTNMIQVAEESGLLPEILERLHLLVESEIDTRERIKEATRYPKIVIAAIFVAFFILMGFVVPRFVKIYEKSSTELPVPTKIMIWMNNFIWSWNKMGILIVVLIICYIAFKKLIETKEGRLKWDGFKLKVYVFGPLFLKISMSRFARTLSLMTKSGVPIIRALDVVSGVMGNVVLQNTIILLRNAIVEGKALVEPMKTSSYFPDLVVQMVAVGEETGRLDDMLLKVAEYYEREVDYTIKKLSSLIEPVVLLILAVMVTFLALAIFLPMWNIMQVFK